MITQTGKLNYGVEYNGALHYDFELRLPMVADNIAALEEVGTQSNLRVNTAIYVRCLTKLGTIPKEALTYEFLATNMVDDDYDALAGAISDLKKKRKVSSVPSPTTDSPSSSSDSTVSTSAASPA